MTESHKQTRSSREEVHTGCVYQQRTQKLPKTPDSKSTLEIATPISKRHELAEPFQWSEAAFGIFPHLTRTFLALFIEIFFFFHIMRYTMVEMLMSYSIQLIIVYFNLKCVRQSVQDFNYLEGGGVKGIYAMDKGNKQAGQGRDKSQRGTQGEKHSIDCIALLFFLN